MPVAVFTVGCLFKTDKFNWSTMLNMGLVTLGVAVASYGVLGAGAKRELVGAGAAAALHMPCSCPAFPTPPLLCLSTSCSADEANCNTAWSCLPLLCHLPPCVAPDAFLLPAPAAGELNFNIVGVMFQLGSIFSESIRLVMVQILLQVCACC